MAVKSTQNGAVEELFAICNGEGSAVEHQRSVYNVARIVHIAGQIVVGAFPVADVQDGQFVYYISEPVITNDFKGYGAFLQASLLLQPLMEEGSKK